MSIKIKHIIRAGNTDDGFDLLKKIFNLNSDQDYRVYILDHKKLRSSQANKYYWGVVIKALSDLTGYTAEEMHDILKYKFNLQTALIGDDIIEFGGSTASMNNTKFTNYIEQIRIWANTDLNCHIPDPGELSDEAIIEMINEGH